MANTMGPGKIVISPEIMAVIDEIARDLREANVQAEGLLARAKGDTGHLDYRVKTGQVRGLRNALATLVECLEVSAESRTTLNNIDTQWFHTPGFGE